MAGLGLTKGLSYVNDWEKDIERVYQRAEYAAGVKAQKEQETMFYANLMKKGHGSTPYVEGKLNSFYKDHTKKVADFAINNPNFRTDVSKMQEFLDLNDQFINNPILQQDQQVKQQFEKLQNAYNTKQITKTHFDREMKKYTDYAYADPNTDAQLYMFEDPKQVDINKLVQEGQQITPTITQVKKRGMQVETYQGVDPTAVMNTAVSLLADEDNQIAFQKEYDDAIARDPSIKETFKSLQEYTASRIEAGNKLQMVKTDYDDAYLRNLSAGGKEGTPGQYFMRNIYPTLSSLKDGERSPGDIHGLSLTSFGEINRPITTNPGSGVKVYKPGVGYVDLGVTINMEATNFTGYLNHGGKLYGEVMVNANSTMLNDKGEKMARSILGQVPGSNVQTADQYLTDLGFVATPSGDPSNPKAGFMQPAGRDYTGKVYVELDTSPSRLVDVDRSYGGQTEVPKAQEFYSHPTTQQKIYDMREGIEAIGQADPEAIKEFGKPFEYVKYRGSATDANGNKYGRNPDTGKVFIVKKS